MPPPKIRPCFRQSGLYFKPNRELWIPYLADVDFNRIRNNRYKLPNFNVWIFYRCRKCFLKTLKNHLLSFENFMIAALQFIMFCTVCPCVLFQRLFFQVILRWNFVLRREGWQHFQKGIAFEVDDHKKIGRILWKRCVKNIWLDWQRLD